MLTWRSYAKQRLTTLHPNIMVQRSPSHFQTGTFYWAHVSCVISSADYMRLWGAAAREVVRH